MTGCRRFLLIPTLLLLSSLPLHAESILRLLIPECEDPGSTVLLQVEALLDTGENLKSYDVRIAYDPEQITLLTGQMSQGAWLQSGGPTFFWHDIIGDQLFVNAAILGPGLNVSGSGILFQLPVMLGDAGIADLDLALYNLYDVDAQLLDTLPVPAAVQAPCTDYQLQIEYLPGSASARLSWQAQPLLDFYEIHVSSQPWGGYSLYDTTTDTEYTDPVTVPARHYRLQAGFLPSR